MELWQRPACVGQMTKPDCQCRDHNWREGGGNYLSFVWFLECFFCKFCLNYAFKPLFLTSKKNGPPCPFRRGGGWSELNGQCPFKRIFFFWMSSLTTTPASFLLTVMKTASTAPAPWQFLFLTITTIVKLVVDTKTVLKQVMMIFRYLRKLQNGKLFDKLNTGLTSYAENWPAPWALLLAGGPNETRRLKYCSTINILVWHVLQQLGRGLTSARNAKNFIQRRSSPLGNLSALHTTHVVVHSILHSCSLSCTGSFVYSIHYTMHSIDKKWNWGALKALR